jgi:hypothetical protein
MPTRFNSKSSPQFGVPGIADKTHQGSPELTIPSVGIEDVDMALFSLFEKEICLQVSGDNTQPKKVPVIFASGEKWAMLKKKRALRDKNGSLILPLITIIRNSIVQDFGEDITGRGINQQTGEIIVRRRLDKSDRNFQNLINRFLLRNQKNVATNSFREHLQDQILTDRSVGEDINDSAIMDGAWLADIKSKNIYETIVVPSPQFCKLNYEISMWTQYTQHMNQLLEQVMSSFLPQGNSWKLDTPKGYWFIANVEGNSYEPENNFEEMAQEERMIRHKFSVTVKAYIFAGTAPGVNIPIKRYVSSPIVSFESGLEPAGGLGLGNAKADSDDPFLGSDDPTLPLADGKVLRRDQRKTGTRLFTPKGDNLISDDPALRTRAAQQNKPLYQKIASQDATGAPIQKLARVYRVTSTQGETVIKPANEFTTKPSPATADALLGGLTYDTADDL